MKTREKISPKLLVVGGGPNNPRFEKKQVNKLFIPSKQGTQNFTIILASIYLYCKFCA